MTSIDDAPVVPCSDEAEDWIIGALLKRGDVIGEVLDLIEPSDFHSSRHRAAFRAAVELARQRVPIEYGTLTEQMATSGSVSRSDALMWLSDVDLRIPSAAYATYYAGIVAKLAMLRRVIGAAQAIAED